MWSCDDCPCPPPPLFSPPSWLWAFPILQKRDERERESKGGESFFFGRDYDVALFLFSFSFCSVGVVFGVCLEQGERPEKRRVAVAAAKKMVGGENFMRNLNESSYVLC